MVDSAYYQYSRSKELYKSDNDLKHEGIVILNTAILKENVKDFLGSEVTAIKALRIFHKLNAKIRICNAYNTLGVAANGLENYEQSLKFHSKAEALEKELNKPYLQARSLNNMGVAYLHMKEYGNATKLFRKALRVPNLKAENPRLYAMLLGNLAHGSWKNGDMSEVETLFRKSYKIRDSIGHKAGKIINKIHYGEFSYKMGAKKRGLQNLKEAREMSERTDNFEYLLESLLLLSKLDTVNSAKYLRNYVHINDSLVTEERKIRNKFARISYETDEYIQETKNLNEQKFWIIIISFSSLAIILLIYFLREQRIKNKELLFDREQQLANEHIYKLLLEQQARIEEGRNQERTRISEELHDGILGELFGTRMSLGFLDFNLSERSSVKFKKLVDNLKRIEQDIRRVSHDLRNNLVSDRFNSELSFVKILEEYLERISVDQSFEVTLDYDKNIEWALIEDSIKIHIYRIIQEALQNIIRHSEATLVRVKIQCTKNILVFEIQDNGRGFELGKAREGIGLKNIRSRARKINADLEIESRQGTLIRLKIFIDYEK